jgi:type I restriction enzyme M protein
MRTEAANILRGPVDAADIQIVRGDTLRSPAFFSGDNLATFDCVIATAKRASASSNAKPNRRACRRQNHPPFSLEKWGDEVWSSDPYGRNFAGMPPAKSGDFAWMQHRIKSMAPKTGRMAVALSHGALFGMGKEGELKCKTHDGVCYSRQILSRSLSVCRSSSGVN